MELKKIENFLETLSQNIVSSNLKVVLKNFEIQKISCIQASGKKKKKLVLAI